MQQRSRQRHRATWQQGPAQLLLPLRPGCPSPARPCRPGEPSQQPSRLACFSPPPPLTPTCLTRPQHAQHAPRGPAPAARLHPAPRRPQPQPELRRRPRPAEAPRPVRRGAARLAGGDAVRRAADGGGRAGQLAGGRGRVDVGARHLDGRRRPAGCADRGPRARAGRSAGAGHSAAGAPAGAGTGAGPAAPAGAGHRLRRQQHGGAGPAGHHVLGAIPGECAGTVDDHHRRWCDLSLSGTKWLRRGQMALFRAVERDDAVTVEQLIAIGVPVHTLVNEAGQTAAELASERCRTARPVPYRHALPLSRGHVFCAVCCPRWAWQAGDPLTIKQTCVSAAASGPRACCSSDSLPRQLAVPSPQPPAARRHR